MFCESCGEKLKKEANFCGSCGKQLKENSSKNERKSKFNLKAKTSALFELIKKRKKTFASLAVFGLLVAASSVSAQYYADFYSVETAIEESKKVSESGDFETASLILEGLEGEVWIAPWQKNELNELKTSYEKDAVASATFHEAEELIEKGLLDEAREKLQTISHSYSKYSEVQEKIGEVSEKIEGNLRANAQAQAAAAERARQEKIAADAAARAAAKAKEEAEDQAEVEKANAFVDEALTIYNSINDGREYLSTALDYGFDDVDNMLYYVNRAHTIFSDTSARASSFYSYRTPSGAEEVPTWLYRASENYTNALNKLLDIGVEYYSYSIDWDLMQRYADDADTNISSGDYYQDLTYNFLVAAGR